MTRTPKTEEDETYAAFLARSIQYHLAGTLLSSTSELVSHEPIYFLYFHATELALKALLSHRGTPSKTLKDCYGHKIRKLYEDSKEPLSATSSQDVEFHNIIELLSSGNAEEGFRYFSRKPSSAPDIQWAGHAVQALIELVEERTQFDRTRTGSAVKIQIVVGATLSVEHLDHQQ